MDRHKGNVTNFTEEQMEWLRPIKDHIATSMHMGRDDFEFSPFVEKGGLGKARQLFLEGLDPLLDELNTRLLTLFHANRLICNIYTVIFLEF